MDKKEITRRLRNYLPRYVAHSDSAHWLGPLPVINQALILFEDLPYEGDDAVPVVHVADVVWVPGSYARYGALLNLLDGKEIWNEAGLRTAIRALRRVSHPRSRLLRLSSWEKWPPAIRHQVGKADADTKPAPPWTVLWSRESPDWEQVLDQLEREMEPSTPNLEWPAPWLDDECSNRYAHLYREVGNAIRGEHGVDLESCWVETVIDVVCSWYDAPRVIKERLLPQSELIRGLERAAREMGQRVNDEGAVELFLEELDEVWGYLFRGCYLE
jgi:hypothetical protein